MLVEATPDIRLLEADFTRIKHILYRVAGINLRPGKEMMVRSRLARRLRSLGMKNYEQYVTFVESATGREELSVMVDILTTNKTSFFRESPHFDFLRAEVLPELSAERRRIRLWSAGCSTGEEPWTLAMLLREDIAAIDRRDVRILATDISRPVLEKAETGIYDEDVAAEVPPQLLQRYFEPVQEAARTRYRVNAKLRKLVTVRWLNLNGVWPMQGPFDVIFCRNVMIYFDMKVREQLVQRYWDFLVPGGYLFIGRSESLAGVAHDFDTIEPAIYRKR